jgi:hypothetical protein
MYVLQAVAAAHSGIGGLIVLPLRPSQDCTFICTEEESQACLTRDWGNFSARDEATKLHLWQQNLTGYCANSLHEKKQSANFLAVISQQHLSRKSVSLRATHIHCTGNK